MEGIAFLGLIVVIVWIATLISAMSANTKLTDIIEDRKESKAILKMIHNRLKALEHQTLDTDGASAIIAETKRTDKVYKPTASKEPPITSTPKNQVNPRHVEEKRLETLRQLYGEDGEKIEKPVEKPITKPKVIEEPEFIRLEEKTSLIEKIKINLFDTGEGETEPKTKEKVAQPTEMSRDWEKFIGENLINKIGIAILLLGIGFFVQYSMEKGWLSEWARIAIGAGVGGALLLTGHFLRKKYLAFSSVLVGGGIAVEYITIVAAFHLYGEIIGLNQAVAFILMVVVTAFAIFLSITYDRKELAIISILGGFATPLLLSTGSGNVLILFTYMTILNVGMLVLAYFKKWREIHIIAFVGTILLYGGWVYTKLDMTDNSLKWWGLVFGTIFYLIFYLMSVVNNIRTKEKFAGWEFSMLLSSTAMYYGVGMYILYFISDGAFQGLFTILMAVFNFGFAYTMYKKEGIDRNLVYLLIGMVLTFVSLTAPAQLGGSQITLFWAAEAVLLLWLFQKSDIKLMNITAHLVIFLMLGSLFMDWDNVYSQSGYSLIFNPAFIATIFAVAALLGFNYLKSQKQEDDLLEVALSFQFEALWVVLAIIFGFIGGLLESNYHLEQAYESMNQVVSFNGIYILGAGLLFFLWDKRFNASKYVKVTFVFMLIGLFLYASLWHPAAVETRNGSALGNYGSGAFLAHYVTLALLIGMLVITYFNIVKNYPPEHQWRRAFYWIAGLSLVAIASGELDHLRLLGIEPYQKAYYAISEDTIKSGYPILWGICGFICMIVGLRFKIKDVRLIGLFLFSIIILKIFLIDIWDMSEGGRIAAFISLGVLLLLTSFLYQRLKNLIL